MFKTMRIARYSSAPCGVRERGGGWAFPLLFAAVAGAALSVGCGSEKEGSAAAEASPESTVVTTASTSASAAPVTTASAASVTSASAAGTAVAMASASASVAPSSSAGPAPSGSAAAGPKEFDCGAKGQKPCPMQGWMKSVMGSASSSGDGEKLAAALSYVASHSPPGMGSWSSISSAAAAKAKAGDIEGAKTSCKQCHDLYKASYKKTMRDRPF